MVREGERGRGVYLKEDLKNRSRQKEIPRIIFL